MRGAHRCPPLAWRGWAATQCLRPMWHMGLLLPGTAGGFLMSSVSWQPFSTPSPSPPLPPPPPPPASSLSLFLPPLTFTSYWVCPLWNGARVREGALSPLRAGGDCEPQMAPGGGLWVAELSPLYMGAPGGSRGAVLVGSGRASPECWEGQGIPGCRHQVQGALAELQTP